MRLLQRKFLIDLDGRALETRSSCEMVRTERRPRIVACHCEALQGKGSVEEKLSREAFFRHGPTWDFGDELFSYLSGL